MLDPYKNRGHRKDKWSPKHQWAWPFELSAEAPDRWEGSLCNFSPSPGDTIRSRDKQETVLLSSLSQSIMSYKILFILGTKFQGISYASTNILIDTHFHLWTRPNQTTWWGNTVSQGPYERNPVLFKAFWLLGGFVPTECYQQKQKTLCISVLKEACTATKGHTTNEALGRMTAQSEDKRWKNKEMWIKNILNKGNNKGL